MVKHIQNLLLSAMLALILSACTATDPTPEQPAPIPFVIAEFDLASDPKIIPFPNNILFAGTLDGTLNIPLGADEDTSTANPKVAMNTLDGFSTVAPIVSTYYAAVDPTTVVSGSTARVFEVIVDPATTAVVGLVGELTAGVDYIALINPAEPEQRTLIVKPLKPLKSNSQYMVVLTNGVASSQGLPTSASPLFTLLMGTTPLLDAEGNASSPLLKDKTVEELTQLEGLRQLTNAMLAVAGAGGVNTADITLLWSFKTQTLGKVLADIRANGINNPPPATDMIGIDAIPSAETGNLGRMDAATFVASKGLPPELFADVGSVVIGAVNLPYYLDDNTINPLGPLVGAFAIDSSTGLPTVNSTQTAPFLMTTPNTTAPAGGWPVIIFQHGFLRDKGVLLGIANTLAKTGFAAIAIDAVMHGDRTFDVDFVTEVPDEATGDPTVTANEPDGLPDSSGRHYLNLAQLLTFRDNVRQSVADLHQLTRILEVQALDVVDNATGAPGADGLQDIQNANFMFVGHSNGGILGTVYLANEPTVTTAVLANPGGGYADIGRNSEEVSPLVNAALAAQGVLPGMPDYESFFVATQTIADDGDPINYGTATDGKDILLLKTTPDAVVPNSATDALTAALGLPQVGNATGNNGHVGSAFVNFVAGDHGSFLGTPASLAATIEMQTETATFLGSAALGAAQVVIGADASIVE
ncbi:MAG: hypothetical protein R8M38_09450 [Mariprofundaceae bacterium]